MSLAVSQKPVYTIASRLGCGSFGSVDLVTLDEKQVAMKTITRTPQISFSSIEQEYTIHAFLSEEEGHPNVVKMLSRSSEGIRTMFFMEYVSGGSLDDQIDEHGMHVGVARNYYKQLLHGLEYLHLNGVVHMDIKPSNLLLDEKNVVKICDFGLARFFQTDDGEDEPVAAGSGTPEYAAPEVWTEREVDGPPLDVWSAAVTLLDMLTGNKPWSKADQQDVRYVQWMHIIQNMDFYGRLSKEVMSLLRSVLTEDVARRATLEACKRHRWVVEELEYVDSGDDAQDSEEEEEEEDCDVVDSDSEQDSNDFLLDTVIHSQEDSSSSESDDDDESSQENIYKRKRDFSEEVGRWKRVKV